MTEKYKLIKSIIDGYADKIGAPIELLPLYGKPDKNVESYIEIDKNNIIHYVIRKSIFRVSRSKSPHMKHIIFDVFDRITYHMAYDQLSNEHRDRDSLKMKVFEKQKELLGQINEEYVNWCKQKNCKVKQQ